MPQTRTAARAGRYLTEPSVPVARMLGLIGGLAVLAAFAMPWFGSQGVILTGQFLNSFLSQATDLRQFLPGATGGAQQVQELHALVLLFPSLGVLGTLLALAGMVYRGTRTSIDMASGAIGVVIVVALLGGVTQLPPGASRESGLWVMGAGGVLLLAGALLSMRTSGAAAA